MSEPPERSIRRKVVEVVACSLTVTVAAAIAATIIAAIIDERWSLVFVIARWLCVAALLVTPLVHQLATRAGVQRRMPWVFQTPATALLLTAESIALDIISAHLG